MEPFDDPVPLDLPVITGDRPVLEWVRMWQRAASQLRCESVGRAACERGFTLTRTDLTALGVSDAAVRSSVRAGRWTRVARGAVAPFELDQTGRPRVGPPPVVDETPPPDEFRRARVLHALGAAAVTAGRNDAVVTGRSAAILAGLPTVDIPPRPELTARDQRTTQGVHGTSLIRSAPLAARDLTDWYGLPMTRAARTVVDVARADRREGIVVVDAALREGLTDENALARALVDAQGWPGIVEARRIVSLACPLAESALESLTRLALHDDDFPPPKPQRFIDGFRVDFLWPELRLILEADGRLKYRTEKARWNEKRREIALSRAGYDVLRVVWSDVVHDWPRTSRWLRREFADAAERTARRSG